MVEVLIVIAVIGIITAIAIPMIGTVMAEANRVKAKRNAQQIANVGAAAQAVGFYFAEPTSRGAAEELVAGVVGVGSFSDTVFRVRLSSDELTAAMPYLKWEKSSLLFRADR